MKKVLLAVLIPLGVTAALLLGGLFYSFGVTAGVRLDSEKLRLSTACVRIYDGEGKQVESARRKSVSSDDLPAYVPQAFIAVEDKRFYSHQGLDIRRIGGALLKNITSFSFREGASTISQQLIKNTHLTSEKTIARKLKEVKLTQQLEKKYSKDEIIELYLNSIYFGHDVFGIAAASDFYFGKEAETLSPAEGAMLAALVKSPNRYSPFRNAEACRSRRNFVLKLMKEQGYLDETAYAEAVNAPLPEISSEKKSGDVYLSLVFDELLDIFPTADIGDLGPIRVYTFLDRKLQRKVEEAEADSDVCALVRDNRTDGLKAFYSTCGALKRLPASTLKPLLVYGPAIEEDIICPATPILDEKTDFNGYCPDDAGGASGKYMSARYALSHSVNIPAVKILNTMGCEKAAAYLDRMGLHVGEEDLSLALALGGMKEGFPLPALADGYAVFAKQGVYAPSKVISRIENSKGKVIYEYKPRENRVFSEETSYLINDMLKTAAKEGTAKKLKNLPYDVCAKTGTAEGKKDNTDAYTIAYTSEDTVAVWLGNRDNTEIGATGGGLPANLALGILKEIYGDRAPAPFPPCDGVEALPIDMQEYEKNHKILLSDPNSPFLTDRKELFKKSFEPLERSTRYSAPKIEKPTISVKNGTVSIVLCQTEYYDYVIKRENRGKETTIYSGKYQRCISDNSVKAGESYRYSVTPYYKDIEGETVYLPLVHIDPSDSLPENWWNQNLMISLEDRASSTSASMSSFLSSSSMKESLGWIAGKSGKKTVQQSS